MFNLRHFVSATFLLAALGAPAVAGAQGFPGVPLPGPPPPAGAPLPVAPLPAPAPYAAPFFAELPPPAPWSEAPRKQWYGWQVLIPTLASDAMFLGGVFTSGSGGNASLAVGIIGLAGHGISGPIVHLAHGKPLKALGSLGLEAGLPALVYAASALAPCTDGECTSKILGLVIGLPLAMTVGPAIDAAAVAWEDGPGPSRTGAPSITVAPLVLPPLHVGSTQGPRPVGLSLVGTF